jgi:hypothetical protein
MSTYILNKNVLAIRESWLNNIPTLQYKKPSFLKKLGIEMGILFSRSSLNAIFVDKNTTIRNQIMALINGLKLRTFLGEMLGEEDNMPPIDEKEKPLPNDGERKNFVPTASEQQQTSSTNLSSKKREIFIDAALEDLDLAEKIGTYLEQYNFLSRPPVDVSASSAQIRQNLEQNLLSCHAVIVLADKVPMVWVNEHLRYYRRIVARRSQPLKLVTVYGTNPSSLNYIHLPNTKIVSCSTQKCLSDHLKEVLQK